MNSWGRVPSECQFWFSATLSFMINESLFSPASLFLRDWLATELVPHLLEISATGDCRWFWQGFTGERRGASDCLKVARMDSQNCEEFEELMDGENRLLVAAACLPCNQATDEAIQGTGGLIR